MNDWSTVPSGGQPSGEATAWPQQPNGGGTGPIGPNNAGRGGRGPAPVVLLVLGIVAVALAAAALVVVLLGSGGGDADSASGSTEPPTTGPARSTSTVVSTTVSTLPTTLPTSAPPTTMAPAVTGVVSRSCGSSGRGDCFLSVRAEPNSVSAEIRRLPEGDPVTIRCTVMGESVKPSMLNRSTAVWARTDDDHYVSIAFVDAPGFDLFTDSHPC